jgi:hypothetical protein
VEYGKYPSSFLTIGAGADALVCPCSPLFFSAYA